MKNKAGEVERTYKMSQQIPLLLLLKIPFCKLCISFWCLIWGLMILSLQTVTEKHKLNVPETMTEVLDVSDEEGEQLC